MSLVIIKRVGGGRGNTMEKENINMSRIVSEKVGLMIFLEAGTAILK